MEPISVTVAGLSFFVAFLALYYSQFRAPLLQFSFGRQFQLYYPTDGGFGFYIPLTILNRAARAGVITHCYLIVERLDDDRSYIMVWNGFGQSTNYGWEHEAIAHPIVLSGKSSISKNVWFCWRPRSKPEFILHSGEYRLRLLATTSHWHRPRVVVDERVEFTGALAREMASRREKHDPCTIIWVFSSQRAENHMIARDALERQLRRDHRLSFIPRAMEPLSEVDWPEDAELAASHPVYWSEEELPSGLQIEGKLDVYLDRDLDQSELDKVLRKWPDEIDCDGLLIDEVLRGLDAEEAFEPPEDDPSKAPPMVFIRARVLRKSEHAHTSSVMDDSSA